MMRQRADDIKRQMVDVENNKGKLKQRITSQIMGALSDNLPQDTAARMVDEQYRHEQKASDDQAKNLRVTVDAIHKHIGETESISSELRRYESSLRDLESKAASYAARAQELMNRGVT